VSGSQSQRALKAFDDHLLSLGKTQRLQINLLENRE